MNREKEYQANGYYTFDVNDGHDIVTKVTDNDITANHYNNTNIQKKFDNFCIDAYQNHKQFYGYITYANIAQKLINNELQTVIWGYVSTPRKKSLPFSVFPSELEEVLDIKFPETEITDANGVVIGYESDIELEKNEKGKEHIAMLHNLAVRCGVGKSDKGKYFALLLGKYQSAKLK